jgi:ferredoxin
MDVLILCKDCSEQFGNDRSNDEMNRILKLSNSSKNVSIHFSECMGICPTGKICTIRLLGNKANSMEKITLLPKEICNIILKT